MKKGTLLIVILLISIFHVSVIHAAYYTSAYKGADAVIKVNGKAISLSNPPLDVKGNILAPAKEIFQLMGINVSWSPASGKIILQGKDAVVSMRIGDRSIFVDGKAKRMTAPPVLVDGKVMIPIKAAAEGLKLRVSAEGNTISLENSYKRMKILEGNVAVPFVVVVDAGHGGKDPGAVYGGVREKDLNLDISVRLNKLLQAEDIKTYMTRVDDRFVELYDRSALANNVKADLLISVHNNAASSINTWGSMSLYYPGGGNTNRGLTAINFATIVQRNLTNLLGTYDHGEISRPNLAVLRTAKMPAVIAEVGYMTNSKELKNLMNPDYRQKAAESLKKAVLQALDKI